MKRIVFTVSMIFIIICALSSRLGMLIQDSLYCSIADTQPTLTGEYGQPDGWETLIGAYVELDTYYKDKYVYCNTSDRREGFIYYSNDGNTIVRESYSLRNASDTYLSNMSIYECHWVELSDGGISSYSDSHLPDGDENAYRMLYKPIIKGN